MIFWRGSSSPVSLFSLFFSFSLSFIYNLSVNINLGSISPSSFILSYFAILVYYSRFFSYFLIFSVSYSLSLYVSLLFLFLFYSLSLYFSLLSLIRVLSRNIIMITFFSLHPFRSLSLSFLFFIFPFVYHRLPWAPSFDVKKKGYNLHLPFFHLSFSSFFPLYGSPSKFCHVLFFSII